MLSPDARPAHLNRKLLDRFVPIRWKLILRSRTRPSLAIFSTSERSPRDYARTDEIRRIAGGSRFDWKRIAQH